MTIPAELLSIVVCPRCRGPLEPQGTATSHVALRCAACRVDYPVRDGIPILIVDDAVAIPA